MEDAFLKKIASYISYHHLLQSDKHYLVALSGGADSVTLLLVLHKLGYAIEAVHCNFRLRGAESDRDERFCRDLCANMHVPFHVVHFDTQGYAALHHQSIELAARNLRYNYFEQLRRDIEAEAICVAHHADDSVETVLMNMMGNRPVGAHRHQTTQRLYHPSTLVRAQKRDRKLVTPRGPALRNRQHQLAR